MKPNGLKAIAYMLITGVMIMSGLYFYKTWNAGEPRWYFIILAMSIALMMSYNLIQKKK